MASFASELTTLRRKSGRHSVEVEDLLKFAILGDAKAVPVIRELESKHGWSRSDHNNNVRIVPMARWADVVCEYLSGGCNALVAYARKADTDSLNFSISVLEVLKSTESAIALKELSSDVVRALPDRLIDAIQISDGINLTFSFKNAPDISKDTECELRTFLHRILKQDLRSHDRARVVCALRGVGNEESIQIISGLEQFDGAWSGLQAIACDAIRKRLKKRN